MLSRIFPRQVDDYRGHRFAVWLLVLFLLVKTFASVNAIGLNPLWTNHDVLRGVERVPLDTFGTVAGNAAIVLFAWWGVTALMFTVLGFIAVVRYRALVPLVYLLMAVNHIGQQALADTSANVGVLGAGESRPLIVIAVLLIGFGMSVTTPRRLEEDA